MSGGPGWTQARARSRRSTHGSSRSTTTGPCARRTASAGGPTSRPRPSRSSGTKRAAPTALWAIWSRCARTSCAAWTWTTEAGDAQQRDHVLRASMAGLIYDEEAHTLSLRSLARVWDENLRLADAVPRHGGRAADPGGADVGAPSGRVARRRDPDQRSSRSRSPRPARRDGRRRGVSRHAHRPGRLGLVRRGARGRRHGDRGGAGCALDSPSSPTG